MDERHLRYQGWRVVAACGTGAFFVTIPLSTFGVFLKPLCDHFSWSRESASSAYGALTLVAAASAPVMGGLLDRLGARRVILPCMALSGLLVLSLSALSSSLWHLRLVFGLIGLVTMGASPIAYARAIFGWFDAYRGRALGLMLAGAGVSGILIPPAAQALIGAFGWRIAWLALGSSTLVLAVPTAIRFLREQRLAVALNRSVLPGASVRQALGSRVFWTLTVVVFGGAIAATGAMVHGVALLVGRGVPPSRAALSVSAMGAASLMGRLLCGWLLDRFSAARVAMVLLTISAVGTFVLAGAQSLAMGVLAAICIGFGAGGEVDVTPYLLARHFGPRSQSTLYGLTWTAWGLAGASGPILMGRAFDATGSYATVLIQLGLVTLAAAGLMLTLPAAPLAVSGADHRSLVSSSIPTASTSRS